MADVRAQEKHPVFVVYYTFCTVSCFVPLLNRHTHTHRNMCAWSLKLPHFHIHNISMWHDQIHYYFNLHYMHEQDVLCLAWSDQMAWAG